MYRQTLDTCVDAAASVRRVAVEVKGRTRAVETGMERSVRANAETADRLSVAREIGLSGDALGGARFDGSKDIDIYASVPRLTNLELEEMLK